MTLRLSPNSILLLAVFILASSRDVLLRAQTQVTIGASKDNTLYQDTTGSLSDGMGQHFFAGKTNIGAIRRALIAFDLSGKIPQGATILSAALTLNLTRTASLGQRIDLHRVLKDWGEGSSVGAGDEGSGGPATAGDATWKHRFFNTEFWASQGGDFSLAPSDTLTVAGVGSYTWASSLETVRDVQLWLDSASTNFGWILIGNESQLQTTKRFASKDNTADSLRPRLVVTYQGATGVHEPGSVERAYSLGQNYPNPFNPSTTISYTLQRRSPVSVAVWNTLGIRIATLVEGEQEAGSHTVVFDGTAYTTGVYYYRLRAGDFTETRKLLLIR